MAASEGHASIVEVLLKVKTAEARDFTMAYDKICTVFFQSQNLISK